MVVGAALAVVPTATVDHTMKRTYVNIHQNVNVIHVSLRPPTFPMYHAPSVKHAASSTVPLAGRDDASATGISYGPWINVVATWYSGSGGSDGGNVTRTGTTPRNGWTIAVDPNIIPLGSIVQVEFSDSSVHTYRAEDTGGAIVGDRIDIFNSDTSDCMRNGRQSVTIRIINVPHR